MTKWMTVSLMPHHEAVSPFQKLTRPPSAWILRMTMGRLLWERSSWSRVLISQMGFVAQELTKPAV